LADLAEGRAAESYPGKLRSEVDRGLVALAA
jgi:hypothetical protein